MPGLICAAGPPCLVQNNAWPNKLVAKGGANGGNRAMKAEENPVPEFRYRRLVGFLLAAAVAMAAGAAMVFVLARLS